MSTMNITIIVTIIAFKVKFSEGCVCLKGFSDCSCAFISNSFACGILTNKLKAHHSYCVTISLSLVAPSSISLMYSGLLLFMSFKFQIFIFILKLFKNFLQINSLFSTHHYQLKELSNN